MGQKTQEKRAKYQIEKSMQKVHFVFYEGNISRHTFDNKNQIPLSSDNKKGRHVSLSVFGVYRNRGLNPKLKYSPERNGLFFSASFTRREVVYFWSKVPEPP